MVIGTALGWGNVATIVLAVALEKSDNPQIEKLAGEIVRAQEREISQMQTWRDDWYPEG